LDGYLSGATVFADANGNGQLDPGEASTTTNANGNFILFGGAGSLVAFGGTDISTGLPFKGQFAAPSGAAVITPLTTLLAMGANQAKIAAALNLPSGIDLTTLDPISAAKAGDPNGAAVYTAGAKVYDTVSMIASALAGAGGTFSAAVKDAFAGIAAAIEGAGINLTIKASVSALVTQVAQTEHLTLASGVADSVATLIVADNTALDQKLAADGISTAVLGDIAGIELIAQGVESNAIQAAITHHETIIAGAPGNPLTSGNASVFLDGSLLEGQTITAGNGNDAVLAGSNDTITLGNGTDVVNAGDGATISLGNGPDTVTAGANSVVTLGNGQDNVTAGPNSTIKPGNGTDTVTSGGNSTITVGNGNDTINVGKNDTVTVGTGQDSFVFAQTAPGSIGAVTINHFNTSKDVMVLSNQFANSVTYHDNSQGNAVITVDNAGDAITLVGVHASALHTSNFHFV
jgi:hypothetical protein